MDDAAAKTDEELIAAACDGEGKHAFSLLVERHYMTIYKFAYKWCGNKEDAEDVTQNACMKLANNLHSFKGDAAFTTWLYRLVVNTAKDYQRQKNRKDSREPQMADGFDAPTGEAAADEKFYAQQVMAMIHEMPEKQREACILVYAEGVSHKEAAAILGCAETTISWRIHQARKDMNDLLHRKEGRHYG